MTDQPLLFGPPPDDPCHCAACDWQGDGADLAQTADDIFTHAAGVSAKWNAAPRAGRQRFLMDIGGIMSNWAICTSGMIEGPYIGSYDTREDAIAEMVRSTSTWLDNTVFYVAQVRAPKVDFSGVDLCEHLAVWVEGDFGGPAAENWPAFSASDEQQADLARAIEAAFVAWLERHNMVPDWRVVETPERLTLGAAREMAK